MDASVKVIFPTWYDDLREHETPSRGYLSGVVAELPDKRRFELFFSDVVRLQQTLDDEVVNGRPYVAEAGLVIVPEVTTAAIIRAVDALWREGWFERQKPLEDSTPRASPLSREGECGG